MGERGPRDLLLRGQGAQGALVKLVHPLIVADAERIAADALWSSPFLFFERRVLPTRHRLFRVRPRNPFRDRKRFLRVPRDDGRREAPVHGEHNPVSIRSRRRYQVAAMLKAAALLSCACLASSAVAEESPRCASLEKAQNAAGKGTAIAPLTAAQFHFLQGVYVLHPTMPDGLPPGDGALLLTRDHGDDGLILWTLGPLVCEPMPAPKKLIDYLAQVKSGADGNAM